MKTRLYFLFYLFILVSLTSACTKKSSALQELNEMVVAKSEMDSLITILKNDNQLHKDIDPVATPEEVRVMAEKLRLQFPFSYEYFLEKFGNGAYWLYHLDQPINGVDEKYGIHRLGKYRKRLGDTVESDGFGTFKTNSLLCLMTENSNGGAWVWLTSEKSRLGEWPLAYLDEGKLYYKVPNFIEWLKIATHCKGEVIRELDVEYRLGLG